MKHFDLFTGYGGFTLACNNNGITTIGFSEVDKYANALIRFRFPGIRNFGDITQMQAEELPDFDILTFGFPCQDVSIAGQRKGLVEKDGTRTRSGLFYDTLRILETKKPDYFIAENVGGLFSSNGGRDFFSILYHLSKAGYDIQWDFLNTKNFGIPQNRQRIFIVGNIRGKPTSKIFPIRKENTTSQKKTKPEQEQLQTQLCTIIRPGMGHKDDTTFVVNNRGNFRELGTCLNINANYHKGPDNHAVKTLIQIGNVYQYHNPSWGRVYSVEGLAPSLMSQAGGLGAKTGLFKVGSRIRKLIPLECERLQGLPDNWTKWGIDEKGTKFQQSDRQRYKLCGNGITVNVAEEIVRRIIIGDENE